MELQRYGRGPDGFPYILTALPDGYWTPWDVADAEIRRLKCAIDLMTAESAVWRKQCDTLTNQLICCGVAATHPDATLTTRGAYAGKWNSAQAEKVRKLRRDCDDAREKVRILELAEEGAKEAFGAVVQQKRDAEAECNRLNELLQAAYTQLRAKR